MPVFDQDMNFDADGKHVSEHDDDRENIAEVLSLIDKGLKKGEASKGVVNIPRWMDDRPEPKLRGLAPTHNRAMVFIDTEYTGFPIRYKDPVKRRQNGNAEPVDVCAIKIFSNGMIEEYEAKVRISDSHRNNRRYLGWEEVVGYDHDEWKREGRRRDDVARELLEFVSGSGWVSHGAADIQLWTSVWHGSQYPWVPGQVFPVICTEKLARDLLPGLDKYTIDALCKHFGFPPEGKHRARGGAERSMWIYNKLMEMGR